MILKIYLKSYNKLLFLICLDTEIFNFLADVAKLVDASGLGPGDIMS